MATEATTQAEEKQQEKITFTPEQQTRIDEIIRESQGRAGREAKEEAKVLAQKVSALEADLDNTKTELSKAKTPTEKKDAKHEVDLLTAQIAEMKMATQGRDQEFERLKQATVAKDNEIKAAKAEALNIRKKVAMQSVVSNHGFLDVDVVTTLTEGSISLDEATGKFQVTGENGQPRLNSAYEPMSLDEFYAEYASKKPYLVRGDTKSGAGSTTSKQSGLSANGKYSVEQIFGRKSDGALANELAKRDIKEYQRLKVIAKEGNLI